ncbi:MAG: hypothetical protein ACI9R3_002991 [Verrucomicrobiales bacterium]|jgi:hypothetical protein
MFSAPLQPDDPSIKDGLVLWLSNPAQNFSDETGIWNDGSGGNHHAVPVGDTGLAEPFVAGTLASSSQPDVFAQEFSTLAFGADEFDLMVATEINGGEGFEDVTIIGVYKRVMVGGGNTGLIRPIGIGAWLAGETADNYDLGTDPSIRKDNGNIGAGAYSLEHPEDAFLIRVSRMNEAGVNEWFNVDGTVEHVLEDAGAPFITGSDNFYLGDIRVSAADADTADIEIAEVIVYNTALNETQIEGIAEWIQANIGLESGEDPDEDDDGLTDAWEVDNFGNIEAQDAAGDPDEDSLNNGGELVRGTDPNKADTDEDGLNDNVETGTGTYVDASDTGTRALNADTDGDTLKDNVETNTGTFVSATDTGTSPHLADTDEDGLADNVETGTGLFVDATDTGSDPNKADSDGDGFSDEREVLEGSNPNDAASQPQVVDQLAPNAPAVAENLLMWLRTPDVNFDEATGVWMDSSENGNDATAVADLEPDYVVGTLSSGEQPEIFSQPFATLQFFADATDMMIVEGTNDGEGLENLTVVAVYKRTMIGNNPSIVRPVGFGSFINGDVADNYNLGTDPSTRKDNGSIGAGSYLAEHPDDAFLIRISRMNENGINEWFNVDGELEHVLGDTGEPYVTGTDSFYLGDLRVSDGADLEIAEVAVYKAALTESQITGIAAWLQTNIGSASGGSSVPFQISSLDLNDAGTVVTLTWNSNPNRLYAVEVSLDLEEWLEVDDGVESEGEETTFTDAAIEPGTNVLYYRIKDL